MAEFDDGLLRAQGERGTCRVVCFSPRHDLTLGRMEPDAVRRVIDVWAEQTAELGADYRWVQVFENRGVAMGASNPHPHGQVWAGTALPGEAAREDAAQRRHLDADRAPPPARIRRSANPAASAWSRNPRNGSSSSRSGRSGRSRRWSSPSARRRASTSSTPRHATTWPGMLHGLIGRYDGLFERTVPVFDGLAPGALRRRARPTRGRSTPTSIRRCSRATVRKFMVGYELLAETQRDLTAEDAAARLRAVVPGRTAADAGARAPADPPLPSGAGAAEDVIERSGVDALDPDRLRDRLRAVDPAAAAAAGGLRSWWSARRVGSTSSASTPTTTTAWRCRLRSGSRSGSPSCRPSTGA